MRGLEGLHRDSLLSWDVCIAALVSIRTVTSSELVARLLLSLILVFSGKRKKPMSGTWGDSGIWKTMKRCKGCETVQIVNHTRGQAFFDTEAPIGLEEIIQIG